MVSNTRRSVLVLSMCAVLAGGCGDSGTPAADGGAVADGGARLDGGSASDGGVSSDGGPASDGGVRLDGGPVSDGGPASDGGPLPGDGGSASTGRESEVVQCPNAPLTPPATGTCTVTAGDANRLIQGTILTPGRILRNGQLLIDAGGAILCADCSCASNPQAATATKLDCANGVVSPGLINMHDHLRWANAPPVGHGTIRYDHRNDWRGGKRGHSALRNAGSDSTNEAKAWGELRFVLSGATATVAESGQSLFARNLDNLSTEDGLNQPPLQYQTFPLEDTSSYSLIGAGCTYPTFKAADPAKGPYIPHVAEGIDNEARNEFLCLSDASRAGGHDITRDNTFIHAIGLKAADAAVMALNNTSVVWNPRTNTDLYGMSAPVTMYHKLGVNITMGTDWLPSGSMNMLRELACADQQNRNNYNIIDATSGQRRPYFSDEDLVKMITINAARAAKMDDVIGSLASGLRGDVTIWDGSVRTGYSAIVGAHPRDVVVVFKQGRPLFGDATVLEALGSGDGACELIADATPDDCLNNKRVCVQREYNDMTVTYASLKARFTRYRAFYCGNPPNEPSCTPLRNNESNDGIIYDGIPKPGDMDGDGVPDAVDNCPVTFNPPRPVDGFVQADTDGDGVGDMCDPCPLDANTNVCTTLNIEDRDGDGIPNSVDNCPDVANPLQEDRDGDGKGDACDLCPDTANPGAEPCPFTIYQLKHGTVPQSTSVKLNNVLVTAKATNGFYASMQPGLASYTGVDYSSIFVFTTSAPTVNVGDLVSFSARLSSFHAQSQLDTVTALTTSTTGVAVPQPEVIVNAADVAPAGGRAVALEGSLVRIGPLTVLTVDTATQRFSVTGPVVASNQLFQVTPLPQVGSTLRSLTGILRAFDLTMEVEPRTASDLVAGPPRVSTITPATAFAAEGQPLLLTVSLDRAAEANTPIALSTTANLQLTDTVGTPITGVNIALGTLSAAFQVVGIVRRDDGGLGVGTLETVTASADGFNATSSVRVVASGEAPDLANVRAEAPGAVRAGGTAAIRVELTVPAPAGGQPVTLAVDANGSVPSSVIVPEGQASASFTFTAGATAGSAIITATLGTTVKTVTLQITTAIAGGLVINEIDYDQVGTDTREYVEIYNGTGAVVDLTNVALVMINGSNNAEYLRVNFTGSLAADGYLVVAAPGVTNIDPGATVVRFVGASDNLQNGSPDAVALFDKVNKTVIDSLSYEGAITAATITGGNNPYNLVRGTVLPTAIADSNAVEQSLSRCPNGVDTGSSAADWKITPTLTPGKANVCP